MLSSHLDLFDFFFLGFIDASFTKSAIASWGVASTNMMFVTKLTWTLEGLTTLIDDSENGKFVKIDRTLMDDVAFGLIAIGLIPKKNIEIWSSEEGEVVPYLTNKKLSKIIKLC